MQPTTAVHTVLFVCRQNRSRSATAERLFCKHPHLEVSSAGTDRDALVPVNERMLDWADRIVIMDGSQAEALRGMFPGHPALDRMVCLGIPDCFAFLQRELVELLQTRVREHLPIVLS